MLDTVYPVNSIYISLDSTSPASLYGGTWERFGKGKTLVGVDEADTDFKTAGLTGETMTFRKDPIMVSFLDNTGTQHLITKLLNTVYPVGSIYIATSNTSPASFLGGSWERYAKGHTLIGVDEKDNDFIDATHSGGSKTQIVDGTRFRARLKYDSSGRFWFEQDESAEPWTSTASVNNITYDWGTGTWGSKTTGVRICNKQTLNNLPPFQTVYMWRRTA